MNTEQETAMAKTEKRNSFHYRFKAILHKAALMK
jgi:hypothetical protein